MFCERPACSHGFDFLPCHIALIIFRMAAVKPAGVRDELDYTIILILHAARIILNVLRMPDQFPLFPVEVYHRSAVQAKRLKCGSIRKIQAGIPVFQKALHMGGACIG